MTAPDGYARRERDRRRNPREIPGHGEPRRERWDVEHVTEHERLDLRVELEGATWYRGMLAVRVCLQPRARVHWSEY